MVLINSQLLGIDIGLEFITICRFDCSGYLHLDQMFNIPEPAMPGAVTVAICENLQAVDPDFRAYVVGVSLPGSIDSTGRTIKSSTQLPGWTNVPLADWLELRITRRVNLINTIKCLQLAQITTIHDSNIKNDLLSSLGAALLAYKRFKGSLD